MLFCRPTAIFKICLNKKWSLRKQMMVSFLSLSGVSLLLALAVVLLTTFIVGNKVEKEARESLENQIERHLTNESTEEAATIGERFRRIQYAVLDVTAFAFKDALQEDLVLDSGVEGYPLSPAHRDIRETKMLTNADANLQNFYRTDAEVDLGRSSWYFSDNITASARVDGPDDWGTISKTARLDLLWPTMFLNSNDTNVIFMGMPLENSNGSLFRMFPGRSLSDDEGSWFACNDLVEDGCYDPTVRSWYMAAVDADIDESTGLGAAIITDPYIDAIEIEPTWLVTLARAVYDESESLLGVVGVDVRLEQVQLSVEGINFLTSGYSVLATAKDGKVVAAPDTIWDREGENETDTLCNLESDICSGKGGWEDLIALTRSLVYKFTDDGGEGQDYILVTAPVQAIFDLETGDGTTTHYILSVVPVAEIFKPVEGMAGLILTSTTQIMVTTGIVALATLAAVAVTVCVLAGNITRPIKKMTEAARGIARDGAKTSVFGGVAADWGVGRDSESSTRGSISPQRMRAIDHLLCRREDEINTLVKEFSLMITGLGKRGKASTAFGLEETTVYPRNPFTTSFTRAPPTAPSPMAPSPTALSPTAPSPTALSPTAPSPTALLPTAPS